MKQFLLFLFASLSITTSLAQSGTVLSEQKISDTDGNFLETLSNSDHFGNSVAGIGDLNNDGTEDIVVGAEGAGTGGSIYTCFMNSNGTVNASQQITTGVGGMVGTLDAGDDFGYTVAAIGDLDNDGVMDIAVGAEEDSDNGSSIGAVWIIFLNSNGTVKAEQKINETNGGFSGNLNVNDRFSYGLAGIGDLNNDGNEDIAVGALMDDDGGNGRGAVWILFLNSNGTVASHQKISDTQGTFTAALQDADNFGSAIAGLGDLNNDGNEDIAVGAYLDDDGSSDAGAVYILFLNSNGTVDSHQKISDTQGGFTGIIGGSEYFGNEGIANMGDINGDGVTDLAVGQNWDGDGGAGKGSVWTLFLNTNGTVSGFQKISETTGGFVTTLDNFDLFGTGIANIGDLDNDGKTDMAVGAPFDDDGGDARGAVYILNLDGTALPCTDPDVPTITATPSSVCPNASVTLSWTGALNDATSWEVYSGSCGGTPVGSVTINSIAVNPATTTTYFIRGEGGCVTPGSCGSVVVTAEDNTPPTAVCQDINLYLDGSGNATLNPADLDNGSSDACGTVTFSASQTAFDCNDMFGAPTDKMIITGVIDGPLPGGLPKAIELYVADDIADLSEYGVGSANNGGGSDGEEFSMSGSATAGDFIYIASEAIEFNNWFGFAPDFTAGAANINGDDAIELFFQGSVIDVFGDINVDGTGEPWEYLDGWAYRNASTGPDGTTFTLGNWSFSGINVLDGETTNGTAVTPFPTASFTYTGAPGPQSITLTVDDGNGNTADCVSNVSVLDTLSPVADLASLPDINDECSAAMPTAPTATDNCSGALTGVPDVTFPITTQGTTVVTWTYTDASGNTKQQTQNVILTDVTAPTASNPPAVMVECLADVPPVDIAVITDEADNCSATPFVAHDSDVSDGNTCPEVITRTYSVTDDAGNSISVTQTITVSDITNPAPDVATLSPVTEECESTPTAPTATDNCDGSITATPDVTFPITTVGTTTVTWTYTDNCGNSVMQTQDVTITEIDNSVSVTGFTITADATGYQYQWVDCDNGNAPFTGETGQSFTATMNGNYAVEISDGTCIVTSACTQIDGVGIIENGFGSDVSVYPNPTQGLVMIDLGETYKNISIEVVNMMGQVVQTVEFVSAQKIELNIQGADGLYLVRVRSEEGQEATLRVEKR